MPPQPSQAFLTNLARGAGPEDAGREGRTREHRLTLEAGGGRQHGWGPVTPSARVEIRGQKGTVQGGQGFFPGLLPCPEGQRRGLE